MSLPPSPAYTFLRSPEQRMIQGRLDRLENLTNSSHDHMGSLEQQQDEALRAVEVRERAPVRQ